MKNKFSRFFGHTLLPLAIAAIFIIIAINIKNDPKQQDIFIYIIIIGLAVSFFLMALGSLRYYSPAYDDKRDPGSIFTSLSICGIVLSMSVGFGLLAIKEINFYQHSEKTTAKIYAIIPTTKEVTEEDDEGHSYTTTKVVCENRIKYTVDNKEYMDKISSESCYKKIGDKVKIYYDKNDPSEFRESKQAFIYYIMLPVSVIFLFTGLVLTKKSLKIKKRRRR